MCSWVVTSGEGKDGHKGREGSSWASPEELRKEGGIHSWSRQLLQELREARWVGSGKQGGTRGRKPEQESSSGESLWASQRPSLTQSLAFCEFSDQRSTVVQKCSMENPRNRQFVSLRLRVILSKMMGALVVPFRPG